MKTILFLDWLIYSSQDDRFEPAYYQSLLAQLDRLTGTKNKVALANVVQNNEDDMLFAIAFALDLTFHKDPQQLIYATSAMRAVFEEALISKRILKAFPSTIRMLSKKRTQKRNDEKTDKRSKKQHLNDQQTLNAPLPTILSKPEIMLPLKLNSQTEWLTDEHINFAQIHLRYQHPSFAGLTDTLLTAASSKWLPSLDIKPNNTILILHTFDHWILVTNMNLKGKYKHNEWFIYDSLNNQAYYDETLRRLTSIAQNKIVLKRRKCQRQQGASDCGLFAIANAQLLLNYICPSTVVLDQTAMRYHFNDCITSNSFTKFFPRKGEI
jgi:hypothetical protein